MQSIDEACFRTFTEQMERETLSPYAMLVVNTKGRERPLSDCALRTEFQRDRDRILHCKSFRRLKYKTQVFLAPQGDHYRTRLTHTLEVAQIARTISRALRLNEDLTEAISLGHDLGHTPFGHAGENALDALVPGGFRHNEQSLRVAEKLENGVGLNLTYEVRDGILHHRKSGTPCTLEGRVVSLSDRIAYINHDIDDSIRAGILCQEDLPKSCVEALGATHGERINTLILDIIKNSFFQPYVRMSDEISGVFEQLREFMFERVYLSSAARGEMKKTEHVIRMLYAHYLACVDTLPEEFTRYLDEDGPQRVVADYVACMTDRYAINDYKKLFVPRSSI